MDIIPPMFVHFDLYQSSLLSNSITKIFYELMHIEVISNPRSHEYSPFKNHQNS
jgi:hypothetical protein